MDCSQDKQDREADFNKEVEEIRIAEEIKREVSNTDHDIDISADKCSNQSQITMAGFRE